MRRQYDVITIAEDPALHAAVSALPVEELDVDAAVLYTDLLLPLRDMGLNIEVTENHGPLIHNPIRTRAEIETLHIPSPKETMPYLIRTADLLRQRIGPQRAIIGFIGGPYTLAAYAVTGRPARDFKDQVDAKVFMFGHPELWHRLMNATVATLRSVVDVHIAAGIRIIQVFDSWVGSLNPRDYEEFVLPYTRAVFQYIERAGAYSIHFGTGTGALVERFAAAGGNAVSLDWRVLIDEAWQRLPAGRAVQGNLDPERLLSSTTAVENGVADIIKRVNGRPGHIFNLGHGVIRETNPDVLRYIVSLVRSWTTAD